MRNRVLNFNESPEYRMFITTDSSSSNWNITIANLGELLTWEASGDILPIPDTQVVNSPSFDLSNSTGLVTLEAYYTNKVISIIGTALEIVSVDLASCPSAGTIRFFNNKLTEITFIKNILATHIHIGTNLLTTTPDFSKNLILDKLEINSNPTLTGVLDLTNNILLTTLYTHFSNFSSIDLTTNVNLKTLWTYNNNNLTYLDISACTLLEYISISSCANLGNNDFSNNVNLKSLYCNNNNLSSLNITLNTQLESLQCTANNLSILDVTNNTQLKFLRCFTNNIASLDITNCVLLTDLRIYGNPLTSIDMTQCPLLTYFWISNTGISSIDISQNTLVQNFNLNINSITSLDVSGYSVARQVNLASNNLTNGVQGVADLVSVTHLWINGNNFTEVATNQLLADLVATNKSNSVLAYRNNETGQGVIDRATLVTRGWGITNTTT
jgi:hypothetical protein